MEITCIACPLGCAIKVTLEGGKVVDIQGATCKRGEEYAKLECLSPKRMVTSTVTLIGSPLRRLPIKTEHPIPKSKVMDVARALLGVEINAPVSIGDIVAENICDTGVNMVATRHALAISTKNEAIN
ncbi:MAG: DUF1667 domain-containing protein [Clostridiales bacterium]|jgi:CxxC motif-containing protein|nr:DUF1667 domain-containing protein [Clostridiales bacterium]